MRFPEITKGARYSAIVLFVLSLTLAGANLMFTVHAVQTSQRRWCATLGLLTSIPAAKAPPPGPHATSAQRNAYRTWVFYGDLLRLRHDYGCG